MSIIGKKIHRLRCARHVTRMEDYRTAVRVMRDEPKVALTLATVYFSVAEQLFLSTNKILMRVYLFCVLSRRQREQPQRAVDEIQTAASRKRGKEGIIEKQRQFPSKEPGEEDTRNA